MKYTPNSIVELEPHQVFVFGSNSTGFHGAGSAGQAFRGERRNTWRTDPFFLRAKDSSPGSPDRIGNWAVYGVARGFQKGHNGMSYAVETIKHPGRQWHKSTSRREIYSQLYDLSIFALEHPDLEFLVVKLGCHYSGYTLSEMQEVFRHWCLSGTAKPPSNIILPKELEFRQSDEG